MSTIKSSDEHLTLNADGSSKDIKLQANASEKVIVKSDGKVGIGVSSPAVTLELAGNGGAVRLPSGGELQFGGSANMLYGSSSSNFLRFDTNSTERMRVTTDGLTFNGDTAAANALDDYEEGTWTPVFTGSGGGSYTLDSGANTMAYIKIGRLVHIQGGINITGESTPNGYLRISLPFTPMTGADDSDYCEGSASLYNHGGSKPNGIKIFVYGDTNAYFRTIPDNGVGFYLDHGDVDTEFQMRTSFTYIAAS